MATNLTCACPHARSRSQGTPPLTISPIVAPHPGEFVWGTHAALNQSCLVQKEVVMCSDHQADPTLRGRLHPSHFFKEMGPVPMVHRQGSLGLGPS